jgi:hypothetical protein
MIFTPRTGRVLKEIADRLHAVSQSYEKRASLEVLRDTLSQLLQSVTAPAENPADGVETAESIIAQAAGAQNVLRIADKLAIHSFVCQFSMDFDALEKLRLTVDKLIQALRYIGKKEEVSARLAGVLDGIDHGLQALADGEAQLFAAGDKAFASYKSLDQDLSDDWAMAKSAYVLRGIFAKRLEFYQLQQSLVETAKARRASSSPVTINAPSPLTAHEPVPFVPVWVPAEQTAPSDVPRAPVIGAEVDDLMAELEAAINNRPFP